MKKDLVAPTAGEDSPQFLSKAWLVSLQERLGTIVVGEVGGKRTSLGQIVRQPSGSTVSYTITFGGGEETIVSEGTATAVVSLIEDVDTARALQDGATAGELLGEGRIKVHGDADTLLTAQSELAAIAAALLERSPTAQTGPGPSPKIA